MRVVCFGDSNTYGYDPRSFLGGRYPARSRWVDILASRTGWEVINRGENGLAVPGDAWDPFFAGEPDLLIVMLGTNDLLQGLSADETAERMERFLGRIPLPGNQILLIAPPPVKWGAWVTEESVLTGSAQLGGAYEAVARRLGVSCLDAGKWEISLTFDGVHFDEEGHRIFAERLSLALTKEKMIKENSHVEYR